jgi:hypothetical protein
MIGTCQAIDSHVRDARRLPKLGVDPERHNCGCGMNFYCFSLWLPQFEQEPSTCHYYLVASRKLACMGKS